MNPIWIAGNAISIVGALICTSYLVWVRRKLRSMGVPFVTLTLIGVTAAITGMQFVDPELLPFLARNPEKLMQGELWRVITPMFVQPSGISQCIANAFLLIAFMPMVERLYGRALLLVFLGAGVLSQIPLNFSLPYGGGSSSAAFGLIGALFCYLLRERKQALPPFVVLPVVGLLAGAMLAVARDGHGAGMWIGFAIASALPVTRFKFENA